MNKNQKAIRIEDLNRIRRLNEVKFSRSGKQFFWLESIDGIGSLFHRTPAGKKIKISGAHSVGGSVGYGGGEFDAAEDMLIFADRDGSLCRVNWQEPEEIQSITPAWGGCAAPTISPDQQWVLYVYQQGDTDGLALAQTHGLTWPVQLVLGADFYMQPTWHPDREMIAWAEWNHPFMAWDASSVKIGRLAGKQLRLQEEERIDGGQSCAASQPRFSPDGKWMSYIRRDGDWDSLILYNLKEKRKQTLIPAEGSHLCLPNWIQGMRSTAWSPDSKSIWYFRYLRGRTTLWYVALQSGKSTQVDIDPVSWATQIDCSAEDNSLIFLGITPQQPKQIWRLVENKPKPIIANALDGITEIASKPQEIVFPSGDRSEVYGIYFAPYAQAAEANKPPALILDIHGGPTLQDYLCFSSEAAYFTSRGYAYAMINYRGSSGYGYAYQDALRHSWGVVDVEDTLNFAQELVRRGLADPDRLVLKGSSAGGFTALNALIRKPGLFKAAICSYAVGNLVEDATNTHKFERFYHRFLTGNLEKNYQRFVDRSPIFHIEGIKDPVALFHGDRDKVVAPAQSVEIYEKLSSQGVPCILKIYEGEGHGFRKLDTIKDYYQEIERFLEEHL